MGWVEKQEQFFNELAKKQGALPALNESFAVKRSSNAFYKFLKCKPLREVVEFGSGRGEWTLRLLEKGYKVTAVDISAESLNILQSEAKKNGWEERLKIIKGSVEDQHILPKEEFDLSFSYNLLHHVENMEKAVKNMVRLVRQGGRVVVYEPNPLHPWWFIASLFDSKFRFNVEKGLWRCTPWNLKNIFKKAGLTKVQRVPWDLFPFFSPDRFRGIVKIEEFVWKIPGTKIISAVHFVGGYRQ